MEGISAVHSLDVLNLAVNSLEELKANSFSNFKALNSLDLDGNRISNIDENAFNGIEGLDQTFIYNVFLSDYYSEKESIFAFITTKPFPTSGLKSTLFAIHIHFNNVFIFESLNRKGRKGKTNKT